MEIKERKEGEITIIELVGKVDTASSKLFQEKFSEISSRKEKNVVIDCENLDFVASSGLRVFLMFLKHLNKIGGKLVLCSMNELIYEVFEVSGFTPIFTITDNLQAALAEF